MRITGTHVYTLLRCEHAVSLDLHADRALRRPVSEIEEFVRRRGREWEAVFVAGLGYPEPEFPQGDWAAGAAATEAMMREGVEGISQGVLLGAGDKLGIPDLLRREDGESAFGSWHYVVGDIKSSGRPRSDQLLQVCFYSRLLGELQGREPDYGFLVLKDGREERFVLRDYRAAFADVEARIEGLRRDPAASRPFFSPSCGKCHWSELCGPQLETGDDLSLVQGMTRGLRTVLEAAGCRDAAALAGIAVEPTARRTHLESALLRRLKRAARARCEGAPLRESRRGRSDGGGEAGRESGGAGHGAGQGTGMDLAGAAVLHHLFDPFHERMLWLGLRCPAVDPTTSGAGSGAGGALSSWMPEEPGEELAAFRALIAQVPTGVPLLHYGETLPRWFAAVARHWAGHLSIDRRFVDLARRLRGAAVYQGPVFGLGDHVRFALDRDPYRSGEADAAALWAGRPEGEGRAWLEAKGRSDLDDLCALVDFVGLRGESSSETKPAPKSAPKSATKAGTKARTTTTTKPDAGSVG